MDRIILSLAVAAAAYFGPWIIDSSGQILNAGVTATGVAGIDFVEATKNCFLEGTFSISGQCAPTNGFLGKLIAATIVLAGVSTALSFVGLLPLIGRLTSIVTIIAGLAAVLTFGWFAKELLTTEEAAFSDFQWGAYATCILGLMTIFSGLSGLSGRND